jgi:hypothetical protein
VRLRRLIELENEHRRRSSLEIDEEAGVGANFADVTHGAFPRRFGWRCVAPFPMGDWCGEDAA